MLRGILFLQTHRTELQAISADSVTIEESKHNSVIRLLSRRLTSGFYRADSIGAALSFTLLATLQGSPALVTSIDVIRKLSTEFDHGVMECCILFK